MDISYYLHLVGQLYLQYYKRLVRDPPSGHRRMTAMAATPNALLKGLAG